MKLCNIGHTFDYELEKLIRIFLPFEKIEILHTADRNDRYAICSMDERDGITYLSAELRLDGESAVFNKQIPEFFEDKLKLCERELALLLFECFLELTGYKPKWGILTGVRPAKLYSRLCDSIGKEGASEYFSDVLRVENDKITLCEETKSGENAITNLSSDNSFSLYLSIPFCPTRCSYCSFVSHSVDKAKGLIPKYVELLIEELKATAKIAGSLGLRLETVYMGGGTPTTLSAEQLDLVLSAVRKNFDLSHLREYTVEAGRPDTVTKEKLEALKRNGITRISINPQTLNDNVLEAIGRRHTAEQTVEAFNMARELGFDNINMDLIAGLPEDTLESFMDTVEKIIKLKPESVTVHSLSMKRASSLSAEGSRYELEAGIVASKMVDYARQRLSENGILPYYMYRQSKTVGNLENVGYAKRGFEGLYNVYIMDETHTILACGASAVTKLKDCKSGLIERIFNFKYPYEYINRFSEQLERKNGIIEFYKKINFSGGNTNGCSGQCTE